MVEITLDLDSETIRHILWRLPVKDVCSMGLVCRDWSSQTRSFLKAVSAVNSSRCRKRAKPRFSIIRFQVIFRDPGFFSINTTGGCDSIILDKARGYYGNKKTSLCFLTDFGQVCRQIYDLGIADENEMYRHGLEEMFLVLNEDLLLTAQRLQLLRLCDTDTCRPTNVRCIFDCECMDCLRHDRNVGETSLVNDKLLSDCSASVLSSDKTSVLSSDKTSVLSSDKTSVMTFLSKLLIRLRRFPPIVKLELLNRLYYTFSEDDD